MIYATSFVLAVRVSVRPFLKKKERKKQANLPLLDLSASLQVKTLWAARYARELLHFWTYQNDRRRLVSLLLLLPSGTTNGGGRISSISFLKKARARRQWGRCAPARPEHVLQCQCQSDLLEPRE